MSGGIEQALTRCILVVRPYAGDRAHLSVATVIRIVKLSDGR